MIGVRLAPSTPGSLELRTVVAVGGGLATAAVVVTSTKVRDLRLRGSATAQSCAKRGPGSSFYVCEDELGALWGVLSTWDRDLASYGMDAAAPFRRLHRSAARGVARQDGCFDGSAKG